MNALALVLALILAWSSATTPHERLMTWFESYGGNTTNLDLVQQDGTYRLVANDFVAKGTVLIKVPYEIIISDKTIDDGINAIKNRKKRKAFRKIKNLDTRLLVFCMFEMSKGKKSKWAPFFDILKDHVTISLPRTFSDTELNALQDDIAKNEAKQSRNVVIEEFGKHAARLRVIFKSSPNFEEFITLDNYMRWEAKLNVRLYSFISMSFTCSLTHSLTPTHTHIYKGNIADDTR